MTRSYDCFDVSGLTKLMLNMTDYVVFRGNPDIKHFEDCDKISNCLHFAMQWNGICVNLRIRAIVWTQEEDFKSRAVKDIEFSYRYPNDSVERDCIEHLIYDSIRDILIQAKWWLEPRLVDLTKSL